MPTSLAEERAEQARWHLLPQLAHFKGCDNLVANEFRSEDEQHARQSQALRRLIKFCAAEVPFYQKLLRRVGIGPDDIRKAEDLVHLPVLTRLDVLDHAAELRPQMLLGEDLVVATSSGTTGRPTRVEHTRSSRFFFRLFKQRQYRWFRFDPLTTFAAIRLSSQMRKRPDGQEYADGMTCRLPRWRLIGDLFATGPYVAFAATNSVDKQMEWLRQHRPAYLMSYPSSLEHLALAYEEAPPPASLRGLLAISSELTPQIRRRIDRKFGLPINRNYGLNEVGLVASMCPEGGRYHVHAEHSLVEIVNEQGKPCRPGETGRLLVTNLTNHAMPLLRYDSGDFAEATGGPCPCGRTLPTFGTVAGRFWRIGFLPEGTLAQVLVVQEALAEIPLHVSKGLRQYQLHQYRNGSFELRLVAASPLSAEFSEHIKQAWRAAVLTRAVELRIREVDEIARPPGGKFQEFTSDFYSPRDEGTDHLQDDPSRHIIGAP